MFVCCVRLFFTFGSEDKTAGIVGVCFFIWDFVGFFLTWV